MGLLKSMFHVFIYVIAGNVCTSALFFVIFAPSAQLSPVFIFQIIAISAFCALGNLILWSPTDISNSQLKVRYIFHYLYNSIIVLGGMILFDWINFRHIIHIIFVFFGFTFIYLIIVNIMMQKDKQFAVLANQVLKKYQDEE